jgi:Family of unknown function (DUF5678)
LRIVHLDNGAEVDYNGVVRDPAESGTMEPLRLSEMLQGLEGKWVALKGGKVIEAADNADALFKRLRAKQIRDASVLRVPAEQDHEAELVGLG